MIELGSTNNVRAAQGFIDYIKSQGYEGALKGGDNGHVIIGVAEEHFHQVRPLWEEFQQQPDHPKYSDAAWQVGRTDSPLVYGGNKLNLLERFFALSFLTKFIAVVSVVVYVLFLLGQFSSLFPMLQFHPEQPLTWLTPSIVHFSAVHIIFNLLWWVTLSPSIEKYSSKWTLLGLFVVGSLVSSWAQYIVVGPNFGGLSGVVYALVGFCWLYPQIAKTPAILSNAMFGFLLLWLALGFSDFAPMPMANWAHLGGLLSGVVIAFIAPMWRKASR